MQHKSNMQKTLRIELLALAALVLLAVASWGGPGDGIANTAHDFTADPNVTLSGGRGSANLCIFCHTPHKNGSTQLAWNHTLSRNVFDYGQVATSAGTPYPRFRGDNYRGPSAKCLSCHDGSVAIGDISSFRDGPAVLSADRIGTNGFAVSRQVGAIGNMAGNHPVAMPYPLYGTASTYNGVTNGMPLSAKEWVPDPTTYNIRLYSDDGAGDIIPVAKPGATGIECTSCHDPHNKASKDYFFLRGMRGGSTRASGYLCALCHAMGS